MKCVACRVAPPATAASELSAEALRQRVRELYLEQLLLRPRPEGRSAEGWQRILKGFQDALELKLQTLHYICDIHSFALRALRDSHLREVYIGFCAADTSEHSVPEDLVASCVFPERESELFEQDIGLLEVSRGAFGSLKEAPAETIELEPQTSVFSDRTFCASEEVIDID